MYNMIKMRYLATLVATLGAGIPQFAAAQTDVSLPSNQASLEELQDALKRSRDRSQTSEPQGNQLLLLRGIRIADAGQERVETPTTGVDLEQVSGLDDPDTAVILNAYIGRPLSKELLAEILQRTNEALAASGRGFTVAYLPEQDVSDGSVLIEVQQARVGQIGVQVQGDGLPPEEYIRLLRIEPGDVLTKDQIDEETEWLNKSNPYRNAVVIAQPGEQVGSTDVNLLVSNRRPYAFSAGYDNGGTRTTGYDRISFTAGIGNLFGTDQQLNYSLSASPNFNNLVSHGLGYVIPLPWRHLLSVNANYSEFKGPCPGTSGIGRGVQWFKSSL
jgi:hemolysin activation/secretion protein